MKEVVIGFLGCGNVGGGVWSLLTGFSREIAHRDSLSIRIKRVLVRDVNKTRACGVPHELLTTNADDVVSDPEISIVVEFMGGEQPATDYMLRALENQKKRPGDLDLAVTYVNLAQHYAAQDENDARIAACLDKAMERMDSPDAVWEYYYAHTARKIAPALEALGRADAARDLRERADIIYEGT